MKTLFFLGFPNPFLGAGWTRVGFFASWFKNRGHDVSVAGIFSPKSVRQAGVKIWKGIRIYNLCPTFWIEGVPSLILNVLLSFIIYPLLTLLLRPNIVIISVPNGEPAVGAFFSSKLVRAKVVFDVRDEYEDYVISKASSRIYRTVCRLFKALMTSIYAKSDLVVTVTPKFQKGLLLRGIKRVKLIPNGADISVFRPYEKTEMKGRLGFKQDDFILVYGGYLAEYYRLDVVVKAMARLDSMLRSKVKLLVVGPGNISRLIRFIEKLGLKNNIVYLGTKNDLKEFVQILSTGDVGLIPLSMDFTQAKNAWPVKLFEYCACGLPIIATVPKDSILAQTINEFKIGLVISSMDEEKLAEAIRYFYEDKLFRVAAGKRARELVEAKFDRNKIAEEFLSLIKMLA